MWGVVSKPALLTSGGAGALARLSRPISLKMCCLEWMVVDSGCFLPRKASLSSDPTSKLQVPLTAPQGSSLPSAQGQVHHPWPFASVFSLHSTTSLQEYLEGFSYWLPPPLTLNSIRKSVSVVSSLQSRGTWHVFNKCCYATLAALGVLQNSFLMMHYSSFTSITSQTSPVETGPLLSCTSRSGGSWHWQSQAQSESPVPSIFAVDCARHYGRILVKAKLCPLSIHMLKLKPPRWLYLRIGPLKVKLNEVIWPKSII